MFGATLSGGKMQGLLKAPIDGPEILSGGSFGPEASIVAVALYFAVAAVLFAVAIRRGHWRPLHFRLKTS